MTMVPRRGQRGPPTEENGRAASHGPKRTQEPINFFSVPEVADHLGVSARTVRRWIDGRQLVAHHFGRAVRISEGDLREFLGAHRGERP
jgi:excisionase family DNA binding protein